jgi:2-iminobutanoate/2-iminopropanoate deaminase
MPKQIINTPKAPAPIGPYNQSVKAGNFLFISGQIPLNAATGELVSGDIKAEAHQSMKNLEAILSEAKLTFEHVVKTTIFLSDMALFSEVNEVYGSYFKGDYPARETVAVKDLPKAARVEISVIASVDI